MSMLAERKQKQKWTLNPRGKLWSDDSNKFGQKMLEKMGWSAGKGLGAKENGITEHIKQSYKNDSKGIGFEDKGDQWTKHEIDFTSLLQNLGTSKDIEIKKPEVSLEKKSQNSRARVHYHKFTRGKDLSRYSEKDLANVFGRKTLEKPKIVESVNENSNSSNSSKEFGVQTVHGGSMTDYFKTKFKGILTKTTDEVESDNERPGFGLGLGNSIENLNFCNDTKDLNTFKSKFKNMFAKPTDDNNHSDNNPEFGFSETHKTDKVVDIDNGEDKKKKKYTKVVINECFDNPGFTDLLGGEHETINQEKKRKRKNKPKKIMTFDNAGLNVDLQNEETDNMSTPGKENKTRKRKLDTIVEESVSENGNMNSERMEIIGKDEEYYTPTKKQSKKDKKRKGVDNKGCSQLDDICEENEFTEDSNERKSTKKKNKPLKEFGIVNTACTEIDVNNEDDSSFECTTKLTKKKKKQTIAVGIVNTACTEINEDNSSFEPTIKSSTKKKKRSINEIGIVNAACTDHNVINDDNSSFECTIKSSTKKKKRNITEVGIYNVACTEDFKDDLLNDERNVSNDMYEVKSAKKKKKQKPDLGIDNAACTEVNINSVESELSTTKESKKSKKKKTEENGIDNLACNANSVEQNIEEAIESMSNAIDDYQLELENEINERKVSDIKGNPRKLNGHFRNAKKSIKNVIVGNLRYNFEGSNLPKIPGYGMDR